MVQSLGMEVYILAFGAVQTLAAIFVILSYLGITPKNQSLRNWGIAMKDRRLLVAIILSIGGFCFSGYGLYHSLHPGAPKVVKFTKEQANSLNIVRHRKFVSEVVPLDGFDYQECIFQNVKFKYNGTAPFRFSHNDIIGSIVLTSENDSVMATMAISKGLGLLGDNVPILTGPELKPSKNITPLKKMP